MLKNDAPFVGVAKWGALCVAVIVGLGIPAEFLYLGYKRQVDIMSAETHFISKQIERLIVRNPEFWQFEDTRLQELIEGNLHEEAHSFSNVYDHDGRIIVSSPSQRPIFFFPVLTRQQPLFDYGTQVGRLEITHSLSSLYEQAALMSLASLTLGVLIYLGLRIPVRLLREAWDQVSYLASHDVLTGLPNRTTLIDRLQQAVVSAANSGSAVAIYSLDLDHFKEVNDTLGHAAGDKLLIQAVERMKPCLRQEDTLARLGGDEFIIIQPGISNSEAAGNVAESIISALSTPYHLNGQTIHVGVSIGIMVSTEDESAEPQQLLIKSDLALYKAKNEARGTYWFFREEMNVALQARKALEYDLRLALENDELEMYYQPQVRLSDECIIGMEALLRWHHPQHGDISPTTIIPVAETSGLIRPLTKWVLGRACHDALSWQPLKVAVNLSPSLFIERDISKKVAVILEETGLPGEQLELEITEEILIADTDTILTILKEVKDLGVHIAMDDFGTGYSSLNYLRKFPFDKIKIDRSFISAVNDDPEILEIVRAIIKMAHALKMEVNAEGVETIGQADILRSEKCEEVQGYYYGRPMKKDEIDTLLRTTRNIAFPCAGADMLYHTG